MKNQRIFKMNGKQYSSMMEIARELGKSRIYPKDFEKYGIKEVVPEEETTEKKDDKVDKPVKEISKSKAKSEEPSKVEKTEQTKVDHRFTRKTGTPEEIEEAQKNVSNMSIVEFNDFIKHFTVDSLVKMAEDAGVNTWDGISNEPIRRMRLLMEIKGHYFPNDKTPVKPNSCWKKVELQKLIELANSNNLDYKTSTDDKIQRMWVIVALNKAGLTPDNIPQEEVANA